VQQSVETATWVQVYRWMRLREVRREDQAVDRDGPFDMCIDRM
jgi:hypothetical protein